MLACPSSCFELKARILDFNIIGRIDEEMDIMSLQSMASENKRELMRQANDA